MSKKTNDDGLTFDEWNAQVDAQIATITEGLGQSDFADWLSWDAWQACEDPEAAAQECLENDDIGIAFLELAD